MEIFSIICSLLSLLASGFAVYKVLNIEQKLTQSGEGNKGINQTVKGNNNTQIGRQ